MRLPPLPVFVLAGVLIGTVMPMPKQQHKDSVAIVVDTPPRSHIDTTCAPWCGKLVTIDTSVYRIWNQPQSLMFVTGGATVLTITPEGKFILGPGATVDSAALAIVKIAEYYGTLKRCEK